MDTEIRTLFNCIHEEVVQLFYRWKIFRQLFDSGEENVSLLNQSGSNVFALLQGLIIENAFLTLCRLTDPEMTGSFENLSIRNILRKMAATLKDENRGDLSGKLARLEAATEKIRSHRNKRITHLDLKHAIKAEPLPAVEYGDLEDALGILECIMRDLHRVLWNADTRYREPTIAYGCDGDHLLRVLRDVGVRRGPNKAIKNDGHS